MESVSTSSRDALPSLPTLLAIALVIYGLGLVVYRLYLHPLAKFPGPKIAAVTSFYEGYYEIVLKGQYSKQISKLHDEYGEWYSMFHSVFVKSQSITHELISHCAIENTWLRTCRPYHSSHTTRATYSRLTFLR